MTIAKLDTVVFIVAMIAFLLLNIPVTESKEIPIAYFTVIYYVSIALASLLSGGLIAVVLMLYGTVHNIIQIVGLGRSDHPLIFEKEVEEDKEEDEQENKEEVKEKGNLEEPAS